MVKKRFVVIVGGWRPVGEYDTLAEAQEKAMSCVSSMVDIRERMPGTFADLSRHPVKTESGEEE